MREELASVEIAASDVIHTVCHVTIVIKRRLLRATQGGAAAQGLAARGSGDVCGFVLVGLKSSGPQVTFNRVFYNQLEQPKVNLNT